MRLPERMVSFDRVCRRYAKVLFLLPPADRDLAQTELASFLAWAKADTEGWRFLTSEFLPLRYQKDFLDQFCEKTACSAVTRRFFQVLAQHHRLALLPKILLAFEQLLEREGGETPLYMISSMALSAKEEKNIVAALRHKIGDRLILYGQTDASLILGAVFFWGAFMIDLSLSRTFHDLKKGIHYGTDTP